MHGCHPSLITSGKPQIQSPTEQKRVLVGARVLHMLLVVLLRNIITFPKLLAIFTDLRL
jgi:hypothetical protein